MLAQVRAVLVDGPDLIVPAPVGRERNLLAVERPTRVAVEELVVGYVAPVRAIAVVPGPKTTPI